MTSAPNSMAISLGVTASNVAASNAKLDKFQAGFKVTNKVTKGF